MTYEPWKYDYRVQTLEDGENKQLLVWQWRYGDWEFELQLNNEHAIDHFFAERDLVAQSDHYAYWR